MLADVRSMSARNALAWAIVLLWCVCLLALGGCAEFLDARDVRLCQAGGGTATALRCKSMDFQESRR